MPTTFANTIDGNEILAKRAECDYAGNDIQQTYATKSEVTTGLASKQDTISDLATIRSGAADGATAVQPGDLATVATTGAYSDLSGTPTIPAALSAGNGIDITNNVVSADLDGTSLTNGANGLSVTLPVPDTTGASQGDVLSVGQSGIEWTTPALTSDNVYKATATDTYATLYQAYMVDHKLVYYGEGYPLILKNLTSDNSSNVSGRVYFQTSYMDTSKTVSIIYDEKRLAEGVPLGSLTNYTQEIIPASSGSHVGQFITPAANGIMAWATINQVPASTSADEDKVLTVDSTGSPVWATPSGGGSVTDVEVNGTSVVNASGVAEVTVPSGTQLVPAATSADADKVLTVDAQGTPAWSTPAAGGVTDVEVDGTSVVSGGVASITMPTVDQTYDASSANAQSGVAVAGALATKQDTISDLSTIRSGAADGATAVQPGDLATVAVSGSYNDLSNTPTILPYKPVVAGTGVRIVDDTANNRIVVEADETVLWSGSDTTVALSESYTNFEKIRVVYNTNDNAVYETIIYSAQSGTSFTLNAANCNSTQTQYKMACFTLASQSITFHSASTISFTDSGFASRSTTNPVTLVKVVGVNRVASN